MNLPELLDEHYRQVMHLPDPTGVLAVLAAAAVNLRLPGSRLWLMLVGAPASGKSLAIRSLERVPRVHPVSTFTRASLLTLRKGHTLGGVLAGMGGEATADGSTLLIRGARGLLLVDDFTAMLSGGGDALDLVREVFDGKLRRDLAAASLRFEDGQVGLIAGVTEAIERHRDELGTKGDRFVYLALPDLTAGDRAVIGHTALRASADPGTLTRLADAVAAFVGGLATPTSPLTISDADEDRLVAAADFAALARSAVLRDPNRRDIDLIPQPEAPGRLAGEFAQLWRGLTLIGAEPPDAWRVIRAATLGCIPSMRRRVILALVDTEGRLSTGQVALRMRAPTTTVRRALEELAAHGVVDVEGDEGDGRGTAYWGASPWAREHWSVVTRSRRP